MNEYGFARREDRAFGLRNCRHKGEESDNHILGFDVCPNFQAPNTMLSCVLLSYRGHKHRFISLSKVSQLVIQEILTTAIISVQLCGLLF